MKKNRHILRTQDFTNFRLAKGCGYQTWKIQYAGKSSSCSATLSLDLLECPHLHSEHWYARLSYFSAFPFFLRRIPKSSTSSTSKGENLTNNLEYLKLIFSGSCSKAGAISIRLLSRCLQVKADHWLFSEIIAKVVENADLDYPNMKALGKSIKR